MGFKEVAWSDSADPPCSDERSAHDPKGLWFSYNMAQPFTKRCRPLYRLGPSGHCFREGKERANRACVISAFYSIVRSDHSAKPFDSAGAFPFLRAGFQAFFVEEAAAARREHQGEAAHEVIRSEFCNFVSGGGRAETEMHPDSAQYLLPVIARQAMLLGRAAIVGAARPLSAEIVQQPQRAPGW